MLELMTKAPCPDMVACFMRFHLHLSHSRDETKQDHQGRSTWNGHANLEVSRDYLSRSYTSLGGFCTAWHSQWQVDATGAYGCIWM